MKLIYVLISIVSCTVTADTPKRIYSENPNSQNGSDSLQPLFASGSVKSNRSDDRLAKLERTSAVRFVNVHYMMNSKNPVKGVLGITSKGRTIDAYFFPGTSNKKAMIIGGMHGSELSSIAVAYEVIAQLATAGQLYYNVLVIPMLFPDNAETAQLNPLHTGSFFNIGRYSNQTAIDPNRQMPTPGKAFDPSISFDHLGRKIFARANCKHSCDKRYAICRYLRRSKNRLQRLCTWLRIG
jgi:hypothetical protein